MCHYTQPRWWLAGRGMAHQSAVPELDIFDRAAAAGTAAVISTLVVNPLELVKVTRASTGARLNAALKLLHTSWGHGSGPVRRISLSWKCLAAFQPSYFNACNSVLQTRMQVQAGASPQPASPTAPFLRCSPFSLASASGYGMYQGPHVRCAAGYDCHGFPPRSQPLPSLQGLRAHMASSPIHGSPCIPGARSKPRCVQVRLDFQPKQMLPYPKGSSWREMP